MRYRKFILTIVILVYSICIAAQDNLHFKHLNVKNGLSDSHVYSIVKDRFGYMWFATNNGLDKYDGSSFKNYFANNDKRSILTNRIDGVFEDNGGNLWVLTASSYILYDRENDNFIIDISDQLSKYGINVANPPIIYVDNQKDLWVYDSVSLYFYEFAYNKLHVFKNVKNNSENPIETLACRNDVMSIVRRSGLVECMDKRTGKIIYTDKFLLSQPMFNHAKLFSYIDCDMNLWIYTTQSSGAWLYNTFFKTWSYAGTSSEKCKLSDDKINSIVDDGKGKIWIATQFSGINIIDKNTGKVSNITNTLKDPFSLKDNVTCNLYLDDSNTMWIGLWKKGINYYNPVFDTFSTRYLKDSYKNINTLGEGPDGDLWFGTDGGGISRYDRNTNVETKFVYDKSTHYKFPEVITCQYLDSKKRLWFGTNSEGVLYYQKGKFHSLTFKDLGIENEIGGKICSILEDVNGKIWMGVQFAALICYDPDEGTCKIFNKKNGYIFDNRIENLYFNNIDKLYITTSNNVYIMDVNTCKSAAINIDLNQNSHSIPTDNLYSVYIDSRGLFWFVRYNDVWIYNPKTNDRTVIGYNHGVTGYYMRGMIEDDKNNIWITTNDGIAKVVINPSKTKTDDYEFTTIGYGADEGLSDEDFGRNAICKTSKGEIVIGGANGYNIFRPDSINKYIPTAKLSFTGLTIGNNKIDVGVKHNNRVIISKSFEILDRIDIGYNDYVFNIGFSFFDYVRPSAVRYSYQLDDSNVEWINLTDDKIYFNDLKFGLHKLRIKGGYLDNSIPEVVKEMEIYIHPPFWLSKIAFVLYFIAIAYLGFLIYKIVRRRQNEKLRLQQREIDAVRQHEIDEMKLWFFTNISHDIRTPLSLIISPLEKLMDEYSDSPIKKTLDLMSHNANHLMRLLDQLLDFRKLDVGAESLIYYHGNFVTFIRECVTDFDAYKDNKGIFVSVLSETSEIEMSFDKNKIQKVMMNLLSNAFRFTPKNGSIVVSIECEEEFAVVKVSDTGIGVKESDKPFVFERFYQVQQPKINYGSGIGLHIVREYIKLHDGDVWLTDNQPQGAIFAFRIPIRFEMKSDGENNKSLNNTRLLKTVEKNDKPCVMVVEDNDDFRSFVAECLKDRYRIIEANNGKDAIDMLSNNSVDIILSDIMMPVMDGLELCNNIKNDINFSHIPVILLSARTTDNYILEGLKDGADDYICKPFNISILKLRIQKFLDWSNKCHDLFRTSDVALGKITISSLDEQLLSKAMTAVENNVSNAEFSVEELSEIVCMSRGYFYKKILAITGKTPIEFIRLIRMKKALKILRESHYNISEIAYMVGFNSPRIFANYFKEEYGILPSEYRKDMLQRDNNNSLRD